MEWETCYRVQKIVLVEVVQKVKRNPGFVSLIRGYETNP